MGFVDAKHVMQCMQESRAEDRETPGCGVLGAMPGCAVLGNAKVWCTGAMPGCGVV